MFLLLKLNDRVLAIFELKKDQINLARTK